MRWFAMMMTTGLLTAPAIAAPDARPNLLIVGVPHFVNSGSDVINVQVPDVMSAPRQREIDALLDRLVAYRPTHVAVEWRASKQAELDQRYADYRAGRFKLTANESDQLGLRLAARLGLPRVDAVDWNGKAPGTDAEYDYPAYAEANGRGAEWRGFVTRMQGEANQSAALMACTPVSSWVRNVNTPTYRRADHRTYYYVASLGDPLGLSPGAAWVGSWYARNLRILENVRRVAKRPSDRVIAFYGAGHGYLLDQQARESGHFSVADTLSNLPTAPRDRWTRCPAGR